MMYEDHFGMKNTPFTRNVPVSAMYQSRPLAEALGRLSVAVEEKMFTVVIAGSGCGKSSLTRKFKAGVDSKRFIVIDIAESKLTPALIYRRMLQELDGSSAPARDLKRTFRERLAFIRNVAHKEVVVIIDEAHQLSDRCITEVRYLINAEYDSESPLTLILVGENDLWDAKLQSPRNVAIGQRVDMVCVLPPLTRAETDEYIRTALDYSGCGQKLFTDEAKNVIYQTSGGVMRMINRICTRSLQYTAQRKMELVDDRIVRYVIDHEMLGIPVSQMPGMSDQAP